jgi:hypothetical protein
MGDHRDARDTSPRWLATRRFRASATRRGCVELPRVDSRPASSAGRPTRRVANSSANRRRTRADANARQWRASRFAPSAAIVARRSRAAPRAADRWCGVAVVLVRTVAVRRVDAGGRGFPPRARVESGSWPEARPAGRRTGLSCWSRRYQSRARNRNGANVYRIFSRDSGLKSRVLHLPQRTTIQIKILLSIQLGWTHAHVCTMSRTRRIGV